MYLEAHLLSKDAVNNFKDKRSRWLIVIAPGIFVILFLNLFEPFGVRNSHLSVSYALIMAGYGVVGSIVIYIHEFLVRKHVAGLNSKKISAGKLITWYVWIVFAIAIGNFFYYNAVQLQFINYVDNGFTMMEFFRFLYRTFLISAIPALGLIFYFRYSEAVKTKYVTKPVFLQPHTAGKGYVLLWAENNKDSFSVNASQLLYIRSIDNYASIFYLDDRQTLSKYILRASLKKLEEQLTGSPLIRCHQSYIVNGSLIQNIEGNSRYMKVYLKNVDQWLPVSRKYTSRIKTILSA